MGVAEAFDLKVVVVYVGEAIVCFIAKLVKLAPEVKEASFTYKAFLVRPAMNKDSVKDLELVGAKFS